MLSATEINQEYTAMQPSVALVRDSVKGSPFVKAKQRVYLPHPSTTSNKNSTEQQERYQDFLNGAEFDEFTQHTKRNKLGKLKLDDLSFEPDSQLEYLKEDVDNDGLSMKGLIESCCGNVLEVKWHLLVTDYKGLPSLPIDEISAQELKDANPRPTIKQYPRESVIDWDFDRVDGKMQFTYILLKQTGCVVDHETGARESVDSYVKLALDETGYYQQKRTDEEDWSEKDYVIVGGKNLKFIPVSVAADEEFQSGSLPMELGFLYPIAELAMYRYRISAKYKEALAMFVPSLHFMGVNEQVWDDFKKVNDRDSVMFGAGIVNLWSGTKENPVEMKLLEPNGSLEQFTTFFEDNKNKVRALGGTFKTDQQTQRTATEVMKEASDNVDILAPMVNSIESAVKWQIGYCAMFEGMVTQDEVGSYVNDINLSMPRDFGVSKLSVEEAKAILELHLSGLYPREETLKLLELGGWTASTADELLTQMGESM